MELAHLVLEAVRYEHWLRFHFLCLAEENQQVDANTAEAEAFIEVPAAMAQTSRMAEPHLAPLMDALNRQPITLESSRQAVFAHVAALCQSTPESPDLGRRLMDLVHDPNFRRNLDAFHTWVQECEEKDEECPPEAAPSFQAWQADFQAWAASQQQHITTIPSYAPPAHD